MDHNLLPLEINNELNVAEFVARELSNFESLLPTQVGKRREEKKKIAKKQILISNS